MLQFGENGCRLFGLSFPQSPHFVQGSCPPISAQRLPTIEYTLQNQIIFADEPFPLAKDGNSEQVLIDMWLLLGSDVVPDWLKLTAQILEGNSGMKGVIQIRARRCGSNYPVEFLREFSTKLLQGWRSFDAQVDDSRVYESAEPFYAEWHQSVFPSRFLYRMDHIFHVPGA